jgi:hypothetical protein
MPDDWFKQNAPAAADGNTDWFKDNAPPNVSPASQPMQSPSSVALDSATAAIPPQLGGGAMQAMYGGLKGLGHSVLGAVKATAGSIPWAGKYVRQAVDDPRVQNLVSPEGPMQKIGYGAEQLGEFFAPGGLVSKGAKALGAATAGMKFAPLLNVGARAGLDALSAAGVAGAQSGGDPNAMGTAALTAGGTSAALGGLAAGAAKVAPALKSSAQQTYAKVLGPTTKENKLLTQKSVAPGLIDRGVTAMTRRGLQGKIASAVDDFGQQVGDAIDQLPPDASLPYNRVMSAIDSAGQKQFTVPSPNGAITPSPDAAAGLQHLDQLKNAVTAGRTIDSNGNAVVDSRFLRELRQTWDGIVSQSKGFTTNDLVNNAKLAAYRSAAGAVREEFASEYPDINRINKEYSFWRKAQQVIDATVSRTQSQATPLTRQLVRTGMASAGLATGGIAHAALNYAEADAIMAAIHSPAWRTTSAVVKDRLANALLSGDTGAITSIAAQIRAANSISSLRPRQQTKPTVDASGQPILTSPENP